MKIGYTEHADRKFEFLKELGWEFTRADIKHCLENPIKIESGYAGARVAISPISKTHNLRVVYSTDSDIITVVTFYPVKVGRYD